MRGVLLATLLAGCFIKPDAPGVTSDARGDAKDDAGTVVITGGNRRPVTINLTPEAAADGPISRLRDGDIINLDAAAGVLEAQVDAATLGSRAKAKAAGVG